jgi:muramoyltetrapeptide carboxypeptidase LdcA involved in peptidoglycan recycling
VRIYVTHIAGRVNRELYDKGLDRLRLAGAEIVHDGRFLEGGHPYLADADDAARLADLQRALTMPGIDAIICARGGYGTMRTLAAGAAGEPLLFPQVTRRLICGFSDVTALHLHAQSRGMISVHGPVVTSLASDPDPDAAVRLLRHLRAPRAEARHELQWLVPPETPGPVSGRLVGGNLAIIAACVHEYADLLADAILLLEDVGEPAYRLDRDLQTLRDATLHAPPAAVVLGKFTRCDACAGVLSDQLGSWGVPVATGLPSGHEFPNLPLTLGVEWSLSQTSDDDPVLATRPLAEVAGAMANPVAASRPASEQWLVGASAAAPASDDLVATANQGLAAALTRLADDLLGVPLGSAIAIRVVEHGRTIASVDRGKLWRTAARGCEGEAPPAGPDALFDLASLTKPLATAILMHQAIEAGAVSLQSLAPPSVLASGQSTLADLLRHGSGLPAYERIFERTRPMRAPSSPSVEEQAVAADLFRRIRVRAARVGRPAYSDPGYIALGRWLEVLAGQPLDALFRTNVALRAGTSSLGYRRLSSLSAEDDSAARSVFTEYCDWRETCLAGVVHDENAQELDGVAGHAGLFGTADDVAKLVIRLMDERPVILSAEGRERMWSTDWLLPGGTHTLGWDTPSPIGSTVGEGFTSGAVVGHLGFTGTSVWIDRARGRAVVALTNRVHGGREVPGINAWRRALHTLAWGA